jgi:hypothetical protein
VLISQKIGNRTAGQPDDRHSGTVCVQAPTNHVSWSYLHSHYPQRQSDTRYCTAVVVSAPYSFSHTDRRQIGRRSFISNKSDPNLASLSPFPTHPLPSSLSAPHILHTIPLGPLHIFPWKRQHEHHRRRCCCRLLATIPVLGSTGAGTAAPPPSTAAAAAASATLAVQSARTHAHQDFRRSGPHILHLQRHSNAEYTRHIHSDTPTFHDNERNHTVTPTSDKTTVRTIVRRDHKCNKHPCNGRNSHCSRIRLPDLAHLL